MNIGRVIGAAHAVGCLLACWASLAWGALAPVAPVAGAPALSDAVHGAVRTAALAAMMSESELIPKAASATMASGPALIPPLPSASSLPSAAGLDPQDALRLRADFVRAVKRRLKVPATEQRAYGERLQAALEEQGLGSLSGEYVVVVDRNAKVQALFIYFRTSPQSNWQMMGAAPVATGLPGQFDHFLTPLGVFEHTPENMDFRAEGTENQNGIRGYGKRDMRIFDLGWVEGERGWGNGGISQMRLQMHATDPDKLEPLLGIRHSKGCIRIASSLNAFLDHHGILDAEYEALVQSGKSLWVLHSDRQATPWAGRYIVVVDSQRKSRPAWSPAPGAKVRARVPPAADIAD